MYQSSPVYPPQKEPHSGKMKGARRQRQQPQRGRLQRMAARVSAAQHVGAGPNAEALADMEKFAARVQQFRLRRGFSQGDVGEALELLFGVGFSQTTVSRFEGMNLSFKNMCKFRPLFIHWMNHVKGHRLFGPDYVKNGSYDPLVQPSRRAQ